MRPMSAPLARRPLCTLIQCSSLTLIVLSALVAAPVFAARADRPFWTEKSSFVEGDDLFVVGVASHAKTVEQGRQQAFERGKVELMNYAQVTDLEAQGLVIETQMTYEEPNADGTVTVFRLHRVPVPKLVAIQGRLNATARAQEQTLERSRHELLTIQQSVVNKQQELEARSQAVQRVLEQITGLQTTLAEKAQRIEQQQQQVEQLLQQLSAKLQVSAPGAKGTGTTSLFETLKQTEIQLDEKEREIEGIYNRAIERIKRQSQKACKYVRTGMTEGEVRALLGAPDGTSSLSWAYGTAKVLFGVDQLVFSVRCERGR